jgi:hypothetical protein
MIPVFNRVGGESYQGPSLHWEYFLWLELHLASKACNEFNTDGGLFQPSLGQVEAARGENKALLLQGMAQSPKKTGSFLVSK